MDSFYRHYLSGEYSSADAGNFDSLPTVMLRVLCISVNLTRYNGMCVCNTRCAKESLSS